MQKNEYYFLNRECILHKGSTGYALYNLLTGGMVSIDQEWGLVLETAEQGLTINEIVKHTKLSMKRVKEIISKSIEKNIGNYYSTRVYIEKYKIGPPYILYSLHTIGIQRCFIELPGTCKANCSFCESPTLFLCARCTKIMSKPDINLTLEFLKRLFSMNCRTLIFHGGDPISNIQQFKKVVGWCRKQNYNGEICVITNGSLIDETIMALFAKYQVHIIIPIFSSSLVMPESKLIEIARSAHDKKVLFTFTNVIFESNPHSDALKGLVSKTNPSKTWTSVVYDINHYGNKSLYPSLVNTTIRVSSGAYYHTKWLHPCLWGTIALTADGDLVPCPHLKSEILGNLKDPFCVDNIFERGELFSKYWELSVSRIPHCQNCEFNCGCLDCRALEMRISGNIHSKQICSLKKL